MAHQDSPPADRRRRRQVVIALAVVLALLAVVGLGVLLTRGDDDERLATTTPSPTPIPSASPSQEPSPEPTPSPSAEPSPTAAAWEPADAFLSPEAASAAEQPGFQVDETVEADPGPALDPCGDREAPRLALVAGSDERVLTSEREAGGSTLVQEVYRYETADDAAAAFATYRQRVEECPRAPVEGVDDEVESTVDEGASADDRLLVQQRYCNPACTDIFTTYAMVVVSAEGLTVATYAVGEDGDPGVSAPPLLDALAEALQAAVPA